MERDGLRAEARAEFERLLEPRRGGDAVTVLGAGADDLEPGRAFLAALAPGGWAVPTWPADCGGRGASAE
ncbi:MAG TPA: acyl-CoA dehydrogenase, partial [Acidimicrobiia bacterium]|nr:acyl-CoA dehydrogenase [Acidimicrobiia bacterium]